MTKLPKIALLAAAAALTLSACSSETEDAAPAETATGDAVETPAAEPAEDVAANEGIPADMLGVWDYVEGTCDPASDLRLEIAADHLTFYESYGEVQAVTRDGENVTISLAMEGEGETWDEDLTYRLTEGGTILESDLRAPVGDGPLLRKRCEG